MNSGSARFPARFARALAVVAALPIGTAADEPPPVTLASVERQVLTQLVPASGTVTAARQAALSPRTAGLVARVYVDAGDHVEQGTPLLELDATLATLAVERTAAALAEAEATLAEARRLHREARELAARRTVATTQVEATAAQVSVNEALVARLAVERREQLEQQARHTLIAPFAGVVTGKHTEAGEWVETGATVLDLVAPDEVRLDVRVPQERYHALDLEAPVSVRLDALPDRALSGHLLARVPVTDATARTFLARIGVDAPPGLLAPGMSGTAYFSVPGTAPVLTLPRDAVIRHPDGSARVWLLVADDPPSVRERRVEIGGAAGPLIEIRAGLEAGQRVILRGNETLRDGQNVRVLAGN